MRLNLNVPAVLTIVYVLVLAKPMVHRDRNSKTDQLSLVMHYLVKYGHLDDKPNLRNDSHSAQNKTMTKDPLQLFSEKEIMNGIKSFQNSFGLDTTGFLDEKSREIMKSPRCGVRDKRESFNKSPIKITSRKPRYVTQGSSWRKKTLQWTIYRYLKPSTLSRVYQKQILDKAFKIWEYSSALKFKYTPNRNQADIVIQFIRGPNGCKSGFDGVGGELAHAFYPKYGGDIHFDADEKWGDVKRLLSVAVHEIGHSLGLSHSNIHNSVMYATYSKNVALDDDDKAGINAIYGACDTLFDGAAAVWKTTYFFRGKLVWKIDDFTSKVEDGYPKTISEEFSPKVPDSVDTCLIWSDSHIYFLKNGKSIGYDRSLKKVKYDNTIAYDWPGIPNDPDASVSYQDKAVTYFFKGDQYWKFNDVFFYVEYGYPKKISSGWPGVPNDLDAAFYSEWYSRTYFFKGTKYWEFNTDKNIAYPAGEIKHKWKNVCSGKY